MKAFLVGSRAVKVFVTRANRAPVTAGFLVNSDMLGFIHRYRWPRPKIFITLVDISNLGKTQCELISLLDFAGFHYHILN